MAETVESAVTKAIELNAQDLANAGTPDAVNELAGKIAEDVNQVFDGRKDKFSYRAVIVILGVVVVLVTITYAMYALTPLNKGDATLPDLPDALISLGAAAIGALAGLLAPAPR